MKLQQITDKDPIQIAHVGASQQQNGNGTFQSENDRWQMEEVYRWLIDNLDEQQLSRLKNQSKEFQVDVLGEKRAKLFRDGNLHLDRFTDSKGNTLTLDELRKKEPMAFDKAGL